VHLFISYCSSDDEIDIDLIDGFVKVMRELHLKLEG
jgi:hypothetical protein